MAKKLAGEVSLKVEGKAVRLRLDIGTMMDLEDYFGMGLVPFLSNRFQEFRLKDLSVLYLAMTGADFTHEAGQQSAAETLVKVGLATAATAISTCLERTLLPPSTKGPSAPGKR